MKKALTIILAVVAAAGFVAAVLLPKVTWWLGAFPMICSIFGIVKLNEKEIEAL